MTTQEAIKYLRMATDEADEYSDVYVEMCNISIQALEEVEQYKSLGTVEELKEAREKQVAKKPNLEQKDGYGNVYERCPNCLSFGISSYCIECGQKIDWGEEDEQG